MTIQFKKGVLELCVLSMLKRDDQYGYDVASKLSQSIDVADGSIYLVLRRLKQDDYVTSYLEESSGGPPRKYYVITRRGEQFLEELIKEWNMLVDSVNSIIGSSAACDEVNDFLLSVNQPTEKKPSEENRVMVSVGENNEIGGVDNDQV